MLLKYLLIIIAAAILTAFVGCSNPNGTDTSGAWLVPKDEVVDGGPGKDGIPALENPPFIDAASATFWSDNELVVGLAIGGDAKALPHQILDWHEIAKIEVGGKKIALTYCPLTGSAIAWSRVIDGSITTFGVSGLLYNSNLIPYDRKTDSNWSQMREQCVNGKLMGRFPETYQVLETKWKTWKELYPQTKVLSRATGVYSPDRYDIYPYENPSNGDYRTNNNWLLFPVTHTDNRLPAKQRVFGVIVDGQSRVYPVSSMSSVIKAINDTLNNTPIVIVGSSSKNFAVGFQSTVQDTVTLTFSAIQNELPVILVDNEGTKWDAFGNGVSG
ncbi:MAG: DUF3179 domain-containing protein, partial [Calditrichia bacterium]